MEGLLNWLWTWSGKFFGYRNGDDLWTYDGKHVGRFRGDVIYNCHGHYLGEIKNDTRLIRRKNKSSSSSCSFTPKAKRMAYIKRVDYTGYVMLAGYEDFLPPESFL